MSLHVSSTSAHRHEILSAVILSKHTFNMLIRKFLRVWSENGRYIIYELFEENKRLWKQLLLEAEAEITKRYWV